MPWRVLNTGMWRRQRTSRFGLLALSLALLLGLGIADVREAHARDLVTPPLRGGQGLGYDCILVNLKSRDVEVAGFQFLDENGSVIVGIGNRTVPAYGVLRIFSGTPVPIMAYCKALDVSPNRTTLTLCTKEPAGLPNNNEPRVCVTTP